MTISPTSPGAHLVAVLVDDLHLDALDRGADRAGLALAVGVVERRHRRGLATGRSPRAPCSRTPPRSRASPRPASPRRPRRRPAASTCRTSSRVGVVEHRAVHRRHALEDVTLSRCDDLQRLAGSKRGISVRQPPARDRRVHPAGLAEGVEQRQRAERDVVRRRGSNRPTATSALRSQVVVGQLGALRLAGGARRVEDHRGVVVVALGDLGGRARARRAAPRTRPGSTTMISAPASSAPASRGLGELVPGEHELRARVARGRSSTSRALSSTFIGTTTPPARRTP